MANPQKENGYTQIANEILENIVRVKLNGTQLRIVMVVWRSTYGWQKKEYELSESYISKATGVHKQPIKRELKTLIELNILTVVKDATFNSSRVMKFNKNYNEWGVKRLEVSKKIPPTELDTSGGTELDTSGGTELDTSGGTELDTQKRNIKKNIKETIKEKDSFISVYDFYLTLDLKKHRTYTDAMRNAIKKAMKQNKYTIEECKTLLKRHSEVVQITKDSDYPVRLRGLDEFFGQKVHGASHLICSEYEESGVKFEKYLKKKDEDKQVGSRNILITDPRQLL